MDFETKSVSRIEIRKYAKAFRAMFGYDEASPFDPIRELDRIHIFMPNVSYEIVEDNELPRNVHAVCEKDENEHFCIKIKLSIYEGARTKHIGGYLMDITHEMGHPFLYKLGHTPVMSRSFQNNSLKPYESAEWQVKAFAGEVMIPYEASKNMTVEEIMQTYNVSNSAAKYRKKVEMTVNNKREGI